jgi:hypothetical protein
MDKVQGRICPRGSRGKQVRTQDKEEGINVVDIIIYYMVN